MLGKQFNTSQKIKSMTSYKPIANSQVDSVVCRQTLSGENLQCDSILNQDKSFVKENINKLKNLLYENKQFAKKNRADLSPQRKFTDNSISKFKYCTPNDSLSEKSKFYPTSQQKSHQTINPRKLDNQSLIIDIKRKINISSSPFQEKLSQGYFTKNIVIPETVSFYGDETVNINKQIHAIIEENQMLESKIGDQEAIISQLTKQNQDFQNKLEKVINLVQQNEQKFHSTLFEKDEIIRSQILEKKELQLEIKSSLEYFFSVYLQKLNFLTKKVNIKVSNVQKRLQTIHQKSLMRMDKKVKLQKLIFQSSTPYRKSKNLLQKSPSIKGDNFQELQIKSHEIQKQFFQREVQYEKKKYEKTIDSYKKSYDDLYEKFLFSQKKNETLKVEIINMKQEQQDFLKQHQQNQKRLQQERRNNQIQHIYFKKQLAQLKVQNGFVRQEREVDSRVKSELATPKSATKPKNTSKSLSLKFDQDRSQRSDRINQSEKLTLNIEAKFKQKERQLLEKEVELQLKQKQLEMKQKEFQQHVKIKQQHFDELSHIKNILQTVHQSNSAEMESNIDKSNKKKIVQDEKTLLRQQKISIHLKQLSKVQYLAKKEKKQKQMAQLKIQSLEKQLQYYRIRTSQLQSVIEQKQNALFQQIRQNASMISDQPVCQSFSLEQSKIYEEQSPFNPMLQTLKKERNKNFEIGQSETALDWQGKVKSRLENAIERLQVLEQLSSSRDNRKDEVPSKQLQ